MLYRSLVIGYHGCRRKVRDSILSGSELRKSEEKFDWLGHGAYFWEDSYNRAEQWAIAKAKASKDEYYEPSVLGAVIDLGNCFNLIDTGNLPILRRAYNKYINICHIAGQEPVTNRGKDKKARFLDCVVFNTMHAMREDEGELPYDSVRGFFTEGNELYDTSGFLDLDHTQICVRNLDCIIGYFMPKRKKR